MVEALNYKPKASGSILDGVTGILHCHKASGRAMAVASTQTLKEMSTRDNSWGYRLSVLKDDKLTTIICRLSGNLGASASWKPEGLSRLVQALICLLYQIYILSDGQFSSLYIQQMRSVEAIWFPSFHNNLYSAKLTVQMVATSKSKLEFANGGLSLYLNKAP